MLSLVHTTPHLLADNAQTRFLVKPVKRKLTKFGSFPISWTAAILTNTSTYPHAALDTTVVRAAVRKVLDFSHQATVP